MGRNSKDVRNEFQIKQLVNFNCANELASLVPLFVDDLICIHFVSVWFLNAVVQICPYPIVLYVPLFVIPSNEYFQKQFLGIRQSIELSPDGVVLIRQKKRRPAVIFVVAYSF